MSSRTFIHSWPALWLWMKHLSPTLIGAKPTSTYTFQKGRLDIQFTKGENHFKLSWEKQGNQALFTFSNRFTQPKKRVDLIKGLPVDSRLQSIELNAKDRVLKLIFDQNFRLIIGAFPAALNVYLYQDNILLDSFLKHKEPPQFSDSWIRPGDPLPQDIPGQSITRQALMNAEHGISFSDDLSTPLFGNKQAEQQFNIAEFTIEVLKLGHGKKAASTASIKKTAQLVLKRWKNKLKKVNQEFVDAEKWPELETRLHALQIGQGFEHTMQGGELNLDAALSPTGQAMIVKIDPDTTFSQSIEATAKKIRKFKDKLMQLQTIIPQIDKDIQGLADLIETGDDEALRVFLRQKGELIDRMGNRETERKPYKKYSSPSGFDILVGRGSSDNDVLTFKVAGKNDWWFHARQIRGSHVILRTGNQEPKRVDIIKAAEFAALNSKAKHSGIVVVQYCQRKHVSKPKGSSPGTVLVHVEKTITIDLDQHK